MSDDLLAITVACYAGYRGEQTPRSFTLGERRFEIAEILDQWLAPDHRYFKVKDAEGNTCIIRHDIGSGMWELTMFRKASSPSM